jgi:glutaredoxin
MAAREAYEKESRTVEYVNVFDDPASLQTMLAKSKGERKVPVIVEGDRVTVGYKGKG